MVDLHKKFAAADELTAPDLWGEAQSRAAARPSSPALSEGTLGHPRRRLPAAIVAIAVFTVAAIFAWNVLRPLKDRTTGSSQTPVKPSRPLAITGTLNLRFGDFGVAAGAGSVWIAAYGHVQRVNPISLRVDATIPVPHLDDQDGIAVGADVWVTVGSHHEVVEIDPRTAKIIRTVTVPNYPMQIAADGPDVWVISATNGVGRMFHIDGATGAVTSRGQLSTSPRVPFTAGGGSAWVDERSGLRRFGSDGSTAQLEGGGAALTFGEGSVWVLSTGGGILRIDPASGRVISRFPSSPAGIGFAESAGRIWILTDTGSLSKSVYIPDPSQPSLVIALDANTGRIIGRAVKVGFAPAWITAGGGQAWVAKFSPARLLRIASD